MYLRVKNEFNFISILFSYFEYDAPQHDDTVHRLVGEELLLLPEEV